MEVRINIHTTDYVFNILTALTECAVVIEMSSCSCRGRVMYSLHACVSNIPQRCDHVTTCHDLSCGREA